ncbi:wax ester/triacylglycerol synthase domain-containing protein [Pseudonocardia spirodelae]|uniref:diacylglycerol O-acyltransferase n=1 Tax=Pseudonocardia spirodelae TaxID=3133431 RepID=A0ABU8T2L9_9PSEU
MTGEESTPSDWAPGAEMNSFETVMWRIENDPMLRTPAMSCLELDVVPDHERLLAVHEAAVAAVPRLRQRVVEPLFGLGVPRWTTDPHLDLRFHLRRHRLPRGGGWPALMDGLSQFYMTPLDRTRALWEALLVEGLPGGGALYALKMHHSVSDGLGVMQLLGRVLSPDRDTDRRDPTVAPPVAATPMSPAEALLAQAGHDVATAAGNAVGAAGFVRRLATRPLTTTRDAGAYLSSLGRVLRPPSAANSDLLAQRSMTLRLAALDVPFPRLRAAASAAGGSVNDAFLAALLGGYRVLHERSGTAVPDAVPTAMPISLRRPDDPEGGNRIASARFAGPVGERDAARRIALVRHAVRAVRDEPAVDVIGLVSPVLARLPGDVVATLAGPMTKGNDLHASNVPGLRGDHHLAGGRVERFYGYGPLGGGASLITLVTHGDTACIGVGVDTAAFPDHDLLLESLVEGFAEVLALAPGPGRPTVRG